MFKNIDWADVAVSTAEGALLGATGGAGLLVTGGAALVTEIGAGVVRTAVDWDEDGIRVVGVNKQWEDVATDAISEAIGFGAGNLFPAKFFDKRLSQLITRRITKGFVKKSTETAYKWIIGQLTNEAEDYLKSSIIGTKIERVGVVTIGPMDPPEVIDDDGNKTENQTLEEQPEFDETKKE